jgi:hypothetical protein
VNEENPLSNLSITSFWYRDDDTAVPLYSMVGIDRIIQRGKEGTVHFSIRPGGLYFLANMREGYVEIRFNAIPLNNPFAGRKLIIARELKPYHITLENLNPLDIPARELFFIVKATCVLDWGIIDDPVLDMAEGRE